MIEAKPIKFNKFNKRAGKFFAFLPLLQASFSSSSTAAAATSTKTPFVFAKSN